MAYFVHTTIFLFCFRISLFAKLIVLRDNFVEGHRELQQHTSLPCSVYYMCAFILDDFAEDNVVAIVISHSDVLFSCFLLLYKCVTWLQICT